jgi:glutamate racemase
MDNNQPIGIFDSGIGGTSIWKRFTSCFPMKKPYILQTVRTLLMAKKSKDEIIALSMKNTDLLLK